MTDKIDYTIKDSPLGFILVALSTKGICALFIGDHASDLLADLRRRFPRSELVNSDIPVSDQIIELIHHPHRLLNLPLDLRGTPFQQKVWSALQTVPVGQTATYSEIAQKIGAPKAVRAVAQACATNPVSILVPCHRILRKDGSLSGYHWGVERKRNLLDLENPNNFHRQNTATC